MKTEKRTKKKDTYIKVKDSRVHVFDNSTKRRNNKHLAVFSVPFETPFQDPYIKDMGLSVNEVRRTKEEAVEIAEKLMQAYNN